MTNEQIIALLKQAFFKEKSDFWGIMTTLRKELLMSNNTPDYTDNLAFEPKLTWEELCEYAREKKMYVLKFSIFHRGVYFGCDGVVGVENSNLIFADKRTPEQMKTIIDALFS